jgi:hypothetical protein
MLLQFHQIDPGDELSYWVLAAMAIKMKGAGTPAAETKGCGDAQRRNKKDKKKKRGDGKRNHPTRTTMILA